MSNDMRVVKFKMMIRDIFEDSGYMVFVGDSDEIGFGAPLLGAIYDYDKLNDYGKAIMEQEYGMMEENKDELSYPMEYVKNCKDLEYKMKMAKLSAAQLNEYMEDVKFYFIFWSLMILAVDDADKEEHLSLICDFTKMLKITDAEIMDIVRIIQMIYRIEENLDIQTEAVKRIFGRVMRKYGY